MPLNNKPKIALFVGSDVVAHREMIPAIKHMVENDFEPVLFYPKHHASKNPNALQKIFKDYAYVERLILAETIYPAMEANPDNKPAYPSPAQITARYGLQAPVAVEDINDPTFFLEIANDPNLIGCISLRCTQMFKEDITHALTQNGRFLLNVHSGLLPSFRGLYSTPREIFEAISNPETAQGEFGCTVHHIDPFVPVKPGQHVRYKGIDTGNIVEYESSKIQPNTSVYATNMALSDMGAAAVINVVNKYMRGGSLTGYPQDGSKGRYYSYASPEELKEWDKVGLTLFDREEVITLLTKTFSDVRHERAMEEVIRGAVDKHFSQNHMSLPSFVRKSMTHIPRFGKNRDSGRVMPKTAANQPGTNPVNGLGKNYSSGMP